MSMARKVYTSTYFLISILLLLVWWWWKVPRQGCLLACGLLVVGQACFLSLPSSGQTVAHLSYPCVSLLFVTFPGRWGCAFAVPLPSRWLAVLLKGMTPFLSHFWILCSAGVMQPMDQMAGRHTRLSCSRNGSCTGFSWACWKRWRSPDPSLPSRVSGRSVVRMRSKQGLLGPCLVVGFLFEIPLRSAIRQLPKFHKPF